MTEFATVVATVTELVVVVPPAVLFVPPVGEAVFVPVNEIAPPPSWVALFSLAVMTMLLEPVAGDARANNCKLLVPNICWSTTSVILTVL